MSTEQPVDPDLVEQTKQQIRNLVREIAQLSKSELSPLDFYEQVLNRVVSALAAVGGAIWTVGEGGRLELEYQMNLRETRLAESQENQARHGRLLRKVVSTGQGLLVPPHSGAGEEEEGGNPTDFLVVLGPLKSDQETQGVMEIFQRPGGSTNVERGYLRFLLQMCELASDYLKTRRLRHFSDRQMLWAQLENFTRVAHQSLDPKLTAYTIANEGRRLIECDRVSVGICKGRKCYIEAVSGQDTFDKRSNTVTLLSKLATAVVATGEAVWYTGDTTYMAPQVEETIQAYVDESHSKTVAVIPLKRPKDINADEKEAPLVIGALVVEQIEDSRPREGMPQRLEIVAEHSSTALANSLEFNNLFLMPVWRTLGKATWVLKARTLPKTIAIASAVLTALVLMVVWPYDFELEGKGTLQPALKQEVFAQVDGDITNVLVKHGQAVKKGDELVQMRSNEMEQKTEELRGRINTTSEALNNYEHQLQDIDKTRTRPGEKNDLMIKRSSARKELESLQNQMDILQRKIKQLSVRSPIDGVVTTWGVRENLISRPVQRGQILMTVADPKADWELEVHMPETRMGHITKAMQDQGKQDLDVTYITATDPGHKHQGRVKEVHRSAEVHGDEGNTVTVRVALNKQDVAALRQGETVTARVYCGRAPIGYVWFHDLIAWVQKNILFRVL